MKKIATLSLAAFIAVCVLLYAVDYLIWRYKTCERPQSIRDADRAILLRHPGEKWKDRVRLPAAAAGYMCECVVAARRIFAVLVRAQTSGKGNPDMSFGAEGN